MRLNFLVLALVIALSMLSSKMRADTVIFDFENNTAFDNEPAGVTMSATGMTDTVVITTVGVFAPEFVESTPGVFELTGNTIDAETLIGSGVDAIGINNLSINNDNFEIFKGNPSGTESSDINFGESLVIEFDTDVVIQEFNFSSIDAEGFFIVEVEGVGTFDFPDGSAGDDFEDPFAGMVITAGTDITFTVGGTSQDASVRISEITVETSTDSAFKGDVDLSGVVDFGDIPAFIGVLQSGMFQAEADCNCDGAIDFGDIPAFISILQGQ